MKKLVNEINLIDRESAAEILDARADVAVLTNAQYVYRHAANMIRKLPAVDAEPVRRGHWTEVEKSETGHLMECSVCKEWIFHNFNYSSNYCPNCGAKMDLEE